MFVIGDCLEIAFVSAGHIALVISCSIRLSKRLMNTFMSQSIPDPLTRAFTSPTLGTQLTSFICKKGLDELKVSLELL